MISQFLQAFAGCGRRCATLIFGGDSAFPLDTERVSQARVQDNFAWSFLNISCFLNFAARSWWFPRFPLPIALTGCGRHCATLSRWTGNLWQPTTQFTTSHRRPQRCFFGVCPMVTLSAHATHRGGSRSERTRKSTSTSVISLTSDQINAELCVQRGDWASDRFQFPR